MLLHCLSLLFHCLPLLFHCLSVTETVHRSQQASCVYAEDSRFIKALAYGGLSPDAPEDNFLAVMISESTLLLCLQILQDTIPEAKTDSGKNLFLFAQESLPKPLLETGIYSVKEYCSDGAEGEPAVTENCCTPAMVLDAGANPDCYARFSFSPTTAQEITLSTGKTLPLPCVCPMHSWQRH